MDAAGSSSPRTARALLRSPFAWSLVLLGALLAGLMTFSYLYGFLEPTKNLEDLPVGIVNLDRGATVGSQSIDGGRQILDKATAPQPGDQQPVKWTVYRTRAELERAIRDLDVYGGFAVPADFSERIVSLGTSLGAAPRTHLDVLQSSGTGTFGVAVFDRVTRELTDSVQTEVRGQVLDQLSSAGVSVDPKNVPNLGDPVEVRSRDLTPITETSGRGLAAFYFALMMTLAGFAATTAVSIGIDVLAGHEEFDVLGRIVRFPERDISESARWRAKLAVVLVMAPLAALLETLVAVDLLGMQTSSWTETFLFAWLGISTIATLTLVFLTAFGIIGELVAVVFITIFGVPSALGVFPEYAMPGLFRFTSSWHPMRYETDGVRSILFFDGSGVAGLSRAILVLLAWLVGAIVVGGLVAGVVDRMRRLHPRLFGLP